MWIFLLFFGLSRCSMLGNLPGTDTKLHLNSDGIIISCFRGNEVSSSSEVARRNIYTKMSHQWNNNGNYFLRRIARKRHRRTPKHARISSSFVKKIKDKSSNRSLFTLNTTSTENPVLLTSLKVTKIFNEETTSIIYDLQDGGGVVINKANESTNISSKMRGIEDDLFSPVFKTKIAMPEPSGNFNNSRKIVLITPFSIDKNSSTHDTKDISLHNVSNMSESRVSSLNYLRLNNSFKSEFNIEIFNKSSILGLEKVINGSSSRKNERINEEKNSDVDSFQIPKSNFTQMLTSNVKHNNSKYHSYRKVKIHSSIPATNDTLLEEEKENLPSPHNVSEPNKKIAKSYESKSKLAERVDFKESSFSSMRINKRNENLNEDEIHISRKSNTEINLLQNSTNEKYSESSSVKAEGKMSNLSSDNEENLKSIVMKSSDEKDRLATKSNNKTLVRVDVMTTSSEVNFKLFIPNTNGSHENGTFPILKNLSSKHRTNASDHSNSQSVKHAENGGISFSLPNSTISKSLPKLRKEQERKQGNDEGLWKEITQKTPSTIHPSKSDLRPLGNNDTSKEIKNGAEFLESRMGRAPTYRHTGSDDVGLTSRRKDHQIASKNPSGRKDATYISSASVAAIVLAVFVTMLIGCGVAAFLVYKRMEGFRPKILMSDRSCANSESGGYLDDQCRGVVYMNSQMELSKTTPDDLVSLDNDSFLNSLESMTIQNLWTDTIRHTKL